MKIAVIIISMITGLSSYALDLERLDLKDAKIAQPQKVSSKTEIKLSDLIIKEECKKDNQTSDKECEKFINQKEKKD